MKNILSITMLLVLCLSMNIFAQDEVNVNINNSTQVNGILVEGRTLVPVRVVSESMGATVSWEGETKTVTIVKGDKTIKLQVNGKDAKLIGNTTYVPVRFVSESLGLNVEWDGETRTVNIGVEDNVIQDEFPTATYDVQKDLKTLENMTSNTIISGDTLVYAPSGNPKLKLWTVRFNAGEYKVYVQADSGARKNKDAKTELLKVIKYYLPNDCESLWNRLIEMKDNKVFDSTETKKYDGKNVDYSFSSTGQIHIGMKQTNDNAQSNVTDNVSSDLKKLKDLTSNTVISGDTLVYSKIGNPKFKTWTVSFNEGGYNLYVRARGVTVDKEDAETQLLKVLNNYLGDEANTLWSKIKSNIENEIFDNPTEEVFNGKYVNYFVSGNGDIAIYIK
ncbi:copper amine oxidase N-terminal domain-containing protein [Tepidibacter hydrothermalis]|uniref:Copper amine oxidase N-terminal domain-containing protein n=1 Tax=Tepidibacter hydrothermalis TaxID=3036126 RepID=A0ABY8E824_9FIRM|nr:copper amine oxidase N-terminal domain-containing protein [Tepidibacter hydrothermalis]WFD09035.1 copper amine oxidase N-terminal domain-containing protein [Tepidibacter hydrothermalis]